MFFKKTKITLSHVQKRNKILLYQASTMGILRVKIKESSEGEKTSKINFEFKPYVCTLVELSLCLGLALDLP
jgi:hypothetical protein